MSDITNRQAYVFLDKGDVTRKGDEIFEDSYGWHPISEGAEVVMAIVRRPIALPTEQTDKLTVWDEYAKIAFYECVKTGKTDEQTADLTKSYADAMMKARAGK